jgi:hypothetical protein
MEYITVKQDTAEWLFMWLWLELHPINADLDDPMVAFNEGETWQYMGSFKDKTKVIHEFRHRNHPKTNGLYNANLSASDTFSDDQIEDKKNIK